MKPNQVKRTVISVVVLVLVIFALNGIRLVLMSQHPIITAKELAAAIDQSVYFDSSKGVVDIKTGQVYDDGDAAVLLWNEQQQRAVVDCIWQEHDPKRMGYMTRIWAGNHPSMLLPSSRYSLSDNPLRWSCDRSGRWITTDSYLIELRTQKITTPSMPNLSGRSAQADVCFWFCTGDGLVLWNAATKRVIRSIAVRTSVSQSQADLSQFDVSPNGQLAVVPIRQMSWPMEPLGIEYGIVDPQTKRLQLFRLYDVMAGTNPVMIFFLDDRHLLITTMNTKYFVRIADGHTWWLKKSDRFPRYMVRRYRAD